MTSALGCGAYSPSAARASVAPRSNMALMHAVEDEPRSFFYAPGTNTAVMAGGSWKGLLQAVQLATWKVGESHLAVSEEEDKA